MTKYESVKLETKKRIVREFWKLYKVKNIEKITVKNITDACGIYRTTFYLHFSDVYAIREMIEEDVLKDLKKIRLYDGMSEEERRRSSESLYHHFKRNQEYLYILLDDRRHPDFSKLYKSELVKQMCRVYRIDLDSLEKKSELVVRSTLQLLIDLFLNFAGSEMMTWEEIIYIVDGYMNKGIVGTLASGIGEHK